MLKQVLFIIINPYIKVPPARLVIWSSRKRCTPVGLTTRVQSPGPIAWHERTDFSESFPNLLTHKHPHTTSAGSQYDQQKTQ